MNVGQALGISLGVGTVLVVGINSIAIVEPSTVGVPVRLGSVQKTMEPGFHFKMPFVESIVTVSTAPDTFTVPIDAITKDGIPLDDTKTVITYAFTAEQATRVVEEYKEVGRLVGSTLAPSVISSGKGTLPQFSATMLMTQREGAEKSILSNIQNDMALRNIPVTVLGATLTDYGLPKQYVEAKQAEQVAAANALAAATQAKVEVTKAEAAAKVKRIEAEAQSSAQRLLAQTANSTSLAVLQLENEKRLIEKWNGIMPAYYGGNGGFLTMFQQEAKPAAK